MSHHDEVLKAPYHLFFVRLLAGAILLFFGLLHWIVPENFRNILIAMQLPFVSLNMIAAPLAEVIAGSLLLLGLFSRLGGLIGVAVMAVAIYATIVIFNLTPQDLPPGLKELPFVPPLPLPIVTGLLSLYIMVRGGGPFSLDQLRSKR